MSENNLLLRIAKITIDISYLEQYKAALKEGIETALSVEDGILAINAVYDKHNPAQITVFEVYADEEAYSVHLETSHFKKYKTVTQSIVQSLELIEVVPIAFGIKKALSPQNIL